MKKKMIILLMKAISASLNQGRITKQGHMDQNTNTGNMAASVLEICRTISFWIPRKSGRMGSNIEAANRINEALISNPPIWIQ